MLVMQEDFFRFMGDQGVPAMQGARLASAGPYPFEEEVLRQAPDYVLAASWQYIFDLEALVDELTAFTNEVEEALRRHLGR